MTKEEKTSCINRLIADVYESQRSNVSKRDRLKLNKGLKKGYLESLLKSVQTYELSLIRFSPKLFKEISNSGFL